jgi:dihydrodipicolinate reductase
MGIAATPVSQAQEVFLNTRVDVVIDFSNPEASWQLLDACRVCGVRASSAPRVSPKKS